MTPLDLAIGTVVVAGVYWGYDIAVALTRIINK